MLLLFCTYVCCVVLRILVFVCRLVVGCTSFLCRSLTYCVAHTFASLCFISSIMCIVVCLFPFVVNRVRILPSVVLCGLVVYVVGCGDWIVFVHHHYC